MFMMTLLTNMICILLLKMISKYSYCLNQSFKQIDMSCFENNGILSDCFYLKNGLFCHHQISIDNRVCHEED